MSNIYIPDGRLPPAWRHISKRDIAGRLSYETSPAPLDDRDVVPQGCQHVQYADVFHGADSDSVYVLKGSKETHEALSKYHDASEPKPSYVDFVKSLGAEYFADCE